MQECEKNAIMFKRLIAEIIMLENDIHKYCRDDNKFNYHDYFF